jgi:hypothetical protein
VHFWQIQYHTPSADIMILISQEEDVNDHPKARIFEISLRVNTDVIFARAWLASEIVARR